ncbi:MAG: DUF4340 domain-containing protein [Minicystis sp.]
MSSFLRKHLTTIVLSALAVGAGVTVLVIDQGSVTTSEAEQRRKNLFEAWRTEEITDFELDAAGQKARIVRGAANDAGQRPWEVELGGARFAAEEQTVDQYLGALEMAVVERRIPEGSVDRAGFGLASPRLRVAISMGKQRFALRIGGPAPTPADATYAEVEGKGVVVVSRQLAAALDVDPPSFRSRTLVPYAAGDLAGLAIDGEGGARHFTRSGAGAARGAGFRFDGSGAEGKVRVSAAGMERILGALAELGADAYLTDAEADKTLERKVTITLTPLDSSKKRAVIELGGSCPGHPDDVVAVRREPDRASACVAAGPLEALVRPASELVDRRLLAAPADEVVEIKLSGMGKTVELARKGPQWHLRAPEDRTLDAELGRGFLEDLLEIEADHLIAAPDLKALGLEPPRGTVRMLSTAAASSQDGGVEERGEVLEIGADQGEFLIVRRVEDGAVAAVRRERGARLFPDALALRPKKLFDESVQRVRALRVEGEGRTQRFERTASGAFTLVEPKGEGLIADLGLCTDLAQLVTSLSVERWVGTGNDPSFGLDRPRLTIEVDLAGKGDEGSEKKTLRILLGAPSGAGSFARAGGEEAVFLAPRALEETARRWLLDRGSLRVDPETVKTITLSSDSGKRLVVEQSGGVFRIAGAASDPVATTRAAAIRDALGDLSAEGAVGVGKAEKHHGLEKARLTIVVERQNPSASEKLLPARIVVGAGDSIEGTSVFYVRRDRIDATWAVAQAKIRPLLEALGER